MVKTMPIKDKNKDSHKYKGIIKVLYYNEINAI